GVSTGKHDREAVAARHEPDLRGTAAARDPRSRGDRAGHQGPDRLLLLQARHALKRGTHRRTAPHLDRHADCGHDRRWVLRRARKRLNCRPGNSRRGGDSVPGSVVGRALWLLAALLPASLAPVSAEEFRTPSVSTVRVEWRAVLDQFRSELEAAPIA